MNIFMKAAAVIVIASVAMLVLSKQNKEIAILLSVAVCSMIVLGAGQYLRTVVDFIVRLAELGNLDPDILSILLKVVGIGVVTEIAVLICKDSGSSTMGKSLQIMASAAILWISIPLLEKFLDLLENVLKL